MPSGRARMNTLADICSILYNDPVWKRVGAKSQTIKEALTLAPNPPPLGIRSTLGQKVSFVFLDEALTLVPITWGIIQCVQETSAKDTRNNYSSGIAENTCCIIIIIIIVKFTFSLIFFYLFALQFCNVIDNSKTYPIWFRAESYSV